MNAIDTQTKLKEIQQQYGDLVAPVKPGEEKPETILVTGANGQVAQYLVPMLKQMYGDQVKLTDWVPKGAPGREARVAALKEQGIEMLDITDETMVSNGINDNNAKVVINLAALLSGAAEKFPELGREINEKAPIKMAEISKELGVRRFFMPSSMAVIGQDTQLDEAGIYAPTKPKGFYGIAKAAVEASFRSINQTADKFLATCLRYGGVLTCHVPPSDGTTEELDRLIVAVAEYYVKGGKEGTKLGYSNDGVFESKIPAMASFPMIDGDSVGLETIRFLHTPANKISDLASNYNLSEYNASMMDIMKVLTPLMGDKAKTFSIDDYYHLDTKKTSFTKEWAKKLDVSRSENDWGFKKHFTMEASVTKQFNRLVEKFRAEQKSTNVSANEPAGGGGAITRADRLLPPAPAAQLS